MADTLLEAILEGMLADSASGAGAVHVVEEVIMVEEAEEEEPVEEAAAVEVGVAVVVAVAKQT